MSVRMPGFKELVPLFHFGVVEPDFAIHCHPLIYVDLFIHSLLFFHVVTFMTWQTLKCEAVVGSSPDEEWHQNVSPEKYRSLSVAFFERFLTGDPSFAFVTENLPDWARQNWRRLNEDLRGS